MCLERIKYRAYDKREKKMFYQGGKCPQNEGKPIFRLKLANGVMIYRINQVGSWSTYPTEDHSIMQYTGNKDTKGTDIYEDDIVKGNDFVGTVIWEGSGFYVWRHDAEGEVEEWFPVADNYDLEVIGNVWEHPHLLELQK